MTSGWSLIHSGECDFTIWWTFVHGKEHLLTWWYTDLWAVLDENATLAVLFDLQTSFWCCIIIGKFLLLPFFKGKFSEYVLLGILYDRGGRIIFNCRFRCMSILLWIRGLLSSARLFEKGLIWFWGWGLWIMRRYVKVPFVLRYEIKLPPWSRFCRHRSVHMRKWCRWNRTRRLRN